MVLLGFVEEVLHTLGKYGECLNQVLCSTVVLIGLEGNEYEVLLDRAVMQSDSDTETTAEELAQPACVVGVHSFRDSVVPCEHQGMPSDTKHGGRESILSRLALDYAVNWQRPEYLIVQVWLVPALRKTSSKAQPHSSNLASPVERPSPATDLSNTHCRLLRISRALTMRSSSCLASTAP